MYLSREEAARAGRALRPLVKTDAFETTLEIMKEQYRMQVFDSAPHEKEARELVYQEAIALDRLLSTINSLIAVYEAAALEEAEDDEGDTI